MKKIISILTTLVMIFAIETTIFADSSVTYLEKTYDNEKVNTTVSSISSYKLVSSADEVWGEENQDTWYVLDSDVTLDSRPVVL
ncbi:MAG: hypothetical protein Q4F55_01865 [Bacillota bacterium]|nr:hypothetical protein [Bacillota bacterium]